MSYYPDECEVCQAVIDEQRYDTRTGDRIPQIKHKDIEECVRALSSAVRNLLVAHKETT